MQGCVFYEPFAAGNHPGDSILDSLNTTDLTVANPKFDIRSSILEL